MVDMQFGLGQPRDEGVQIGHRILRNVRFERSGRIAARGGTGIIVGRARAGGSGP